MKLNLLRSYVRICRKTAIGFLIAFGGELLKICVSEGRMTVMVCSCILYSRENR